jgi:hypothetical protein
VVTRVLTIMGFCAVILALFVLEFLARREGSRIPTLGQWLGYVMRPWAGRLMILLGWLWLGWHFFSRLLLIPFTADSARKRSFSRSTASRAGPLG